MITGSTSTRPVTQLGFARAAIRLAVLSLNRRFFREPLLSTIHRLQGATCHRGRRPGQEVPSERLQQELEAAVAEQRYEDAAKLRDRLRALQPPKEPT